MTTGHITVIGATVNGVSAGRCRVTRLAGTGRARPVNSRCVSKYTAARVALTATLCCAGAGIVTAAPASAGCENMGQYQYCDLPLRPDGTFDRCRIINGQGVGGLPNFRAGELRCYPINPSQFYPWGEPRYHIDP